MNEFHHKNLTQFSQTKLKGTGVINVDVSFDTIATAW